jgi:hypothetical protein
MCQADEKFMNLSIIQADKLTFPSAISLTRTSRNQTRKLIASGLPQDSLDSELKILSNLEVILRLKQGLG